MKTNQNKIINIIKTSVLNFRSDATKHADSKDRIKRDFYLGKEAAYNDVIMF